MFLLSSQYIKQLLVRNKGLGFVRPQRTHDSKELVGRHSYQVKVSE